MDFLTNPPPLQFSLLIDRDFVHVLDRTITFEGFIYLSVGENCAG